MYGLRTAETLGRRIEPASTSIQWQRTPADSFQRRLSVHDAILIEHRLKRRASNRKQQKTFRA